MKISREIEELIEDIGQLLKRNKAQIAELYDAYKELENEKVSIERKLNAVREEIILTVKDDSVDVKDNALSNIYKIVSELPYERSAEDGTIK